MGGADRRDRDRAKAGLRSWNELNLIQPAAIIAHSSFVVFGITPFQHIAAGEEIVTQQLPIDFAGDARLLRAVDEKLQIVLVRFRGNFPPEIHRAGTVHGCGRSDRAAVPDRAALRRVRAVA